MPSTAPSISRESPAERPRVICVDDEPNVLESLKLLLSRHYDVRTAGGGTEGLNLLRDLGSVPVVMSDMRMPGMSGAEFLAEVARRSPTSARILLTGATDIEVAAQAINTGDLFRFLLKPCDPDQLRATLRAAVELHRLRTAERDLLQRTLLGSIRALTEVLAIADPVAFGRIGRLKELTVAVATRMGIEDLWQVEYASLVCQIGNISLPETTAKKLYSGQVLTLQEQLQVEAALKLGPNVIKHIPRLDKVTRILEELALHRPGRTSDISIEAKLLAAVLSYEAIERTSRTRSAAIQAFDTRRTQFDARVGETLLEVLGVCRQGGDEAQEIALMALRPGMVTAAEYRSSTGALLVPSGTEITASLLAKLLNFPRQQLPPRIRVEKGSG
jgi:response regulator RpfG family c-di-GMP phosphodiesterase